MARAGVPGPVFVECPVDLLYDEAIIRQWYADAAGKGTSIPDRLLRWYLNRHAEQMFAGSGDAVRAARCARSRSPRRRRRRVDARGGGARRAERPLIVIGSQALAVATEAPRIAAAVTRLGVPVYLSGMARGLLGRDHPLQMRHAAPQRAARSRLRAARGRALRLPARLRPARAALGDADRRQPQRARTRA